MTKRKQTIPHLTEKERGIIERAVRKVAKSIMEREHDELRRRILQNNIGTEAVYIAALEFLYLRRDEKRKGK